VFPPNPVPAFPPNPLAAFVLAPNAAGAVFCCCVGVPNAFVVFCADALDPNPARLKGPCFCVWGVENALNEFVFWDEGVPKAEGAAGLFWKKDMMSDRGFETGKF
jgi:hypothetical protein